jgi:glyoxylase-like metal-dependent hydrolase (beta-lactamase superfamily II)
MTIKRTRREVLTTAVRAAAGASLGLLGARLANAQAPAAKARELGGNFHLLKAGAVNVLAVSTGDGLALVDGGPASESAALLKAAAALPGGTKIHTLFNTHWHPEQTGSNEALGKAGATIVAQQNTRLWLTEDVTWPYEDEHSTVKSLPTVARPGKGFYTTLDLELGGKRVTCGYLRDCPHTDGDIYVHFKDDNVLAVGDAVYGTGAGWPWIDWWTGGWIGGIVGGLDALMMVANPETRIVPARGPVLGLDDLKRQYEMYGTIWERLLKKLYAGGSPDEAVAAKPTQEFDDIMGPSETFVRRAFKSLWAYLSPDA